MASPEDRRLALMAIRPHYAEAILDGQKTVEFRKRALASDVREVLIYATLPVSRVIGSFSVDYIVSGSPAEIWEKFGRLGSIAFDAYDSYYAGSATAYGLLVGGTRRFKRHWPVDRLNPPASFPQSFNYIPLTAISHWGEDSSTSEVAPESGC